MLEHATFASPENEAHVVSLSMPSASPGSGRHGAGGSEGGDGGGAKGGGSGGSVSTDGGGLPFPQWLVGHLTRSAACDAAAQPSPSPPAGPQVQAHPQALFRVSRRRGTTPCCRSPHLMQMRGTRRFPERPLRCQQRRCQFVKCFPACCPKAWVQAGLSVLMNMTHNNEAGRDAVAANDGLEALVQLVSVFTAACMDKGERPRRLQVLRVLIAYKIRSDYQRRFHETYA